MEAPCPALPPRLVLYDGECAFCDRTVQRLLRADPHGRLHFAPLQGVTAAAVRQRHPEIPSSLDSMLFVESDGGGERVSWRSEAAWRIYDCLGVRSNWLAAVRRLPRWLADLGYRTFAALRLHLFGRLEQCRVPSAGERGRFLA